MGIYIFSGAKTDSTYAAKTAGNIAGLEVFTKIFLYYVHERAWAQLPLGTLRRVFGRTPKN